MSIFIEFTGSAQIKIDDWREECKKNSEMLQFKPALKIIRIEPLYDNSEYQAILLVSSMDDEE